MPQQRSSVLRMVTVVVVCSILLATGIGQWFGSSGAWLASVALGIAAASMLQRFLSRRLLRPLQAIEDTTTVIREGAVSVRIEVPADAAAEVRAVAEAVNALADRGATDVAEMRRLERVRSEFMANVSHELRTPIFSVQGYLETLLDGAADDPEVSKQFLEKAYSNALRLNSLLSDLIDLSRIESGEMRMSFRYFDLSELIHDLLQTMEIRATQRGVTLHYDQPSQSLSVYGDRERLTQVLTNLIDNAIKYNVEGGSVSVCTTRSNGDVEVAVADTGIGIPEEHVQRIFERFYRVDKDRSRLVGGTGLGLAIVKHILEAHQSTVRLESRSGVGTTVRFNLKAG
ncbi:MAG: HAMP domain-containing protein [Candidatus Kapabacteria bacterium]|nr:HAMP domain-containing protein [Candidatus Kapabacteria bacterium]